MASSRTPLALALAATTALLFSACAEDAPEVVQAETTDSENTENTDSQNTDSESDPETQGTDTDPAEEGEQADPITESADPEVEQDEPEGGGEEAAGPDGTAYQVGDEVEVGDWIVVVTDVNQDATDVFLAADEFNDPPADGRQFVLVTVDTTYTGSAAGTAWVDLTLNIDGADGTTYTGGVEDFCGIVPDDLFSVGEQGPQETATGSICAALPADQVAGSQLGVEEFLGSGGERQLIDLVPAG